MTVTGHLVCSHSNSPRVLYSKIFSLSNSFSSVKNEVLLSVVDLLSHVKIAQWLFFNFWRKTILYLIWINEKKSMLYNLKNFYLAKKSSLTCSLKTHMILQSKPFFILKRGNSVSHIWPHRQSKKTENQELEMCEKRHKVLVLEIPRHFY